MRNSTMSLLEKRYLHHCSFRSEKNQRTWDKLITLMKKVCCQLSPFSHVQVRWDPCTNQVLICFKIGNQVATWNASEPRLSLKEKKSKFLLKSDLSNPGEINYFSKEQLSEQNRDLHEAHTKSFLEMENWREFKSYESMNFRDEDWSKIRTLSMNLRPEFRNYRMKSIVWMTQEILRMPNQYAVDHTASPVNQRHFHLVVTLVECQAVLWECWAATISRQLGHAGFIGKRFCKSTSVFFVSLSRRIQSLDF